MSDSIEPQLPLDGDDTDADEHDLFGSASSEEDLNNDSTQPAAAGNNDVKTDNKLDENEANLTDIDEAELFGTDDDEEPKEGQDEPPARSSRVKGQEQDGDQDARSSEYDARDIFGDMSDDEAEKVEDVVVRRRPEPPTDRIWRGLRLSNALSIEKVPFDPSNHSFSQLVGFKTSKDARGRSVSQLIGPGNAIRWRRQKNADGEELTAEDGRPLYEANSRIVEWEDGSKTLHIGKEVFMLAEETKADRGLLFEENSGDINVCHGWVDRSFKATPVSLDSTTHEMVKTSQYNKFEPSMRTLLVTSEETTDAQKQLALEQEMQERRENKRGNKRDATGDEITARFLEDDDEPKDGGVGGSVLAIKKMRKSTGV